MHEAETPTYWMSHTIETLAETCAALHTQRRVMQEQIGFHRVNGARSIVSEAFISGKGIEVGGGDRPFPVLDSVEVSYGDIRDSAQLQEHFGNGNVVRDGTIDAETFESIEEESQDFIISAHVIEHLKNPFGSIIEGIKRLKVGGTYLIVVPDMRFTFDKGRPPSTFEHLLDDLETGGEPTLLEAYIDHVRYIHPLFGEPIEEDQQEAEAKSLLKKNMDTHVHCWTRQSFRSHLERLLKEFPVSIAFDTSIENEAIFVLRKLASVHHRVISTFQPKLTTDPGAACALRKSWTLIPLNPGQRFH
ncbi:UNVERIFIED_ORG: hypothetical protein J2W85_006637 [Ensifer adhaerens]|nr:hypothetical protein [Ensifer adhaerens]